MSRLHAKHVVRVSFAAASLIGGLALNAGLLLPEAAAQDPAPAENMAAASAENTPPAPEHAAPVPAPVAQQGPQTAGDQPQQAPPGSQHDATELSKKTQNPVADLVSLPFQFNFNNGGALRDQTQMVLNFQPVLPIHLGSKVNLIARTVLPIVSTPDGTGNRDRGLGDAQEQLYFAPSKEGLFTWGVGPVLSLPIATVPAFTTGAWGLGPGGLFVFTTGPFVIGGLANQIWTIKDNADRPRVNNLMLQPFFNYNFAQGWAVGLAPIITANWDADKGNTWTLPLGASITKTLVFNKQPMVLGFQYYRNVVRPDLAPANQLRVVINFLFPGKPTKK